LETGRPSPDSDIVLYATSIAAALDACHAEGFVHGRMIPEDVVVVDGLVKVGGLGLWADLDLPAARRMWRPADRYLAPEVRERGQLSKAGDVYSLAALLVEMASGSGEVPIHQATQALVSAHPRLADVLTPALSPSPRHRPSSASELLRRIRQVLIDDKVPTNRRPAENPPDFFGPAGRSGMPFRSKTGPGPRGVGRLPQVKDSGPDRRRPAQIKETLVGFDAQAEVPSGKRTRGSDARRTLAGYPAPSGRVEVPGRITEPMEVMPFDVDERDVHEHTNVDNRVQTGPTLSAEIRSQPPLEGGSKKRSTDKLLLDGPAPGPRQSEGEAKKKITDQLAIEGPSPGPNRTIERRGQRSPFERTTAEAPAEYPQDTLSKADKARGRELLPSSPPGASKRVRRHTNNPLAEPMGAGRARRASAPPPVQMLQGTASAPPRFATASPATVGDDTEENPVPGDGYDDPDTSSFELRAPLEAGAREQTASRDAVPDPDASDQDVSTLDREWTFDDSVDEAIEAEDGRTADQETDERRQTGAGSQSGDTLDETIDRDPFPEIETPYDDELDEQDRTNVRRRRRRPLTSQEDELRSALPLRAKDTEEPFDAINLADLEKQLRQGDPKPSGAFEFVSARDASKEVTKPDKPRTKGKKRKQAAPKLRSLADEAERLRRTTGDLGNYAPPKKRGTGTVRRAGVPWGTIAVGVVLAGGIGVATWWGLTQWTARQPQGTAVAAPPDAAPAIETPADAAVAVPLPPVACPRDMVLVSGQGASYANFCVDV
ncbi:MAG: protein kinase, partial [Deltaproteobacteria bacterium]|nr:protein kinase [Deltaproteobacteria bacterium]